MAKGFHDIRTEMTAHIRGRVKQLGIKARVRNLPGNVLGIQVSPPGPRVEFTDAEQRALVELAVINGLTGVRGLEASCAPYGANFYLTANRVDEAADLIRKYPSLYCKAA